MGPPYRPGLPRAAAPRSNNSGIFGYLSAAASAPRPSEAGPRASGGLMANGSGDSRASSAAANRLQAEAAAFQQLLQQQKEEEAEEEEAGEIVPSDDAPAADERDDADEAPADGGEELPAKRTATSAANVPAGGPPPATDGVDAERDLRERLLKSRQQQTTAAAPGGAGAGAGANGSGALGSSSTSKPSAPLKPSAPPARSRWLDEDSDEEEAAGGGSAPATDSAAAGGATGGATAGAEGGVPVACGAPSAVPSAVSPMAADASHADVSPHANGTLSQPDGTPSRPPSMHEPNSTANAVHTPGGGVGGGAGAVGASPRRLPEAYSKAPVMGTRCRSVDAFEKIHKIDEGTFGVVYKARDRKSGDVVALKQVKMVHEQGEGFPPTALREVNILLMLKHPNVINTREMVVGDTYDKIFMVMDFMEHDIKQLMAAMKQPFSPAEVKRLMLDLCAALEYMHDRWVFHRDLKPSNLLINNRGEVKVCDFGLARYYHDPLKAYSPTVVTLWYRAPEVLLADGGRGERTSYGPALDTWSLGCIFAELVLQTPLLCGQGEIDQVKRTFELLGTPDDESWPGCSQLHFMRKYPQRRVPFNRLRDKFKKASFTGAQSSLSENGLELLTSMLILNPDKRITAANALKHTYYAEDPPPKQHHMMPTFPSTHTKHTGGHR